jgi:predicted dehydrogenase
MQQVKGPIRSAVIGYGGAFNMGRGHANWMNEAGMQTVAACDVDPARMEAARHDFPGIRTYAAVRDLLQEADVDLCVVILPHNVHAEVSVLCAEAGKHVVVEKPMCITVAEADAMIAAAQSSGVMLSVFHNRRHDGDFLAIREAVSGGMIGDVFQIEASGGGYGHPGSWWRADKRISGGAMYDWGAHFMDWILNLIPAKMTGVNGYFQKKVWLDATNEDHVKATVLFDNGATADLELSSINRAPKPRWRILGTTGAIVDEGGDAFAMHVGYKGHPATVRVPHKKTDWGAYYRGIVAHLTDGAELDVKPEQARRTIAVFEAAERSASSGVTETPAYP